jgi:hypothetical protein
MTLPCSPVVQSSRKDLHAWLTESYLKEKGKKLGIGKRCIRFGKEEDIAWGLIEELVTTITVDE